MIQPFSSVNPETSGHMSPEQIADYVRELKSYLAKEDISEEKQVEVAEEIRLWEDRLAFNKVIKRF